MNLVGTEFVVLFLGRKRVLSMFESLWNSVPLSDLSCLAAISDHPLLALKDSLINLLVAAYEVVKATFLFLLPYFGLICWVAYWLFAVNWTKLYELLFKKGAVISLSLLVLFWIFVWCTVSPPADGYHEWFGFKVGNAVGKTVYVVALMSLAFICGSFQLSGAVNRYIDFSDELEPVDDGHGHHGHDHSHGHDDHGDHSHADHGHAAVAHGH